MGFKVLYNNGIQRCRVATNFKLSCSRIVTDFKILYSKGLCKGVLLNFLGCGLKYHFTPFFGALFKSWFNVNPWLQRCRVATNFKLSYSRVVTDFKIPYSKRLCKGVLLNFLGFGQQYYFTPLFLGIIYKLVQCQPLAV